MVDIQLLSKSQPCPEEFPGEVPRAAGEEPPRARDAGEPVAALAGGDPATVVDATDEVGKSAEELVAADGKAGAEEEAAEGNGEPATRACKASNRALGGWC